MVNHYFWRTYDQKEIDLIEEAGGNLTGFEFKWTESKPKIPQHFLNSYDHSEYKVINRENYLDFIA